MTDSTIRDVVQKEDVAMPGKLGPILFASLVSASSSLNSASLFVWRWPFQHYPAY
jgi:hypothetical protein